MVAEGAEFKSCYCLLNCWHYINKVSQMLALSVRATVAISVEHMLSVWDGKRAMGSSPTSVYQKQQLKALASLL